MISFKSPLQLIDSYISISLTIEDKEICILLMIYLIEVVVSRSWFEMPEGLSGKLHSNIIDYFRNKIDKKS